MDFFMPLLMIFASHAHVEATPGDVVRAAFFTAQHLTTNVCRAETTPPSPRLEDLVPAPF
jgi:hypothetical protein